MEEAYERKEADKYAFNALNSDDLTHDERMRLYAYARIQAILFLGDSLDRIAGALEATAEARPS